MEDCAVLLIIIACTVALAGCLPAVVPTEHDYVLVVSQPDGKNTILDDDDVLYHRFDMLVLDDAYLERLITVYEHTTQAFIATNKRTALTDTVSNRPILVLGSERVGVVRNLVASQTSQGDQEYKLELAIGLGPDSADEFSVSKRQLPRAVALSLLELAGMPHDEDFARAEETLPLDAATDSSWALREGFAVAVEARYGVQDPTNLALLRSLPDPNDEQQRRLGRYALVDRQTYDGSVPADQSPEAVAILMLRLLGGASDYYPQRHMLWMTNYEPPEYAEAKVLLAINRMPNKRDASVRDFATSYADTFPSEQELIESLVTTVLE